MSSQEGVEFETVEHQPTKRYEFEIDMLETSTGKDLKVEDVVTSLEIARVARTPIPLDLGEGERPVLVRYIEFTDGGKAVRLSDTAKIRFCKVVVEDPLEA